MRLGLHRLSGLRQARGAGRRVRTPKRGQGVQRPRHLHAGARRQSRQDRRRRHGIGGGHLRPAAGQGRRGGGHPDTDAARRRHRGTARHGLPRWRLRTEHQHRQRHSVRTPTRLRPRPDQGHRQQLARRGVPGAHRRRGHGRDGALPRGDRGDRVESGSGLRGPIHRQHGAVAEIFTMDKHNIQGGV